MDSLLRINARFRNGGLLASVTRRRVLRLVMRHGVAAWTRLRRPELFAARLPVRNAGIFCGLCAAAGARSSIAEVPSPRIVIDLRATFF
jgi:hypothetical protein